MSNSKLDEDSDSKYDGKYDDEAITSNYGERATPPRIEIISLDFEPASGSLSGPLELKIKFELDRDVIAGYWIIRFLVDSCDRRLIKVLGETSVEDFMEGDNDCYFSCDTIDVSGISPSALANSGLLMAAFVSEGEEVASVNMVVNVTKNGDNLIREILNPLS
mmetsp:Transcript_17180/g.16507  ORF Transcript_17180/g.16507 Transcript_17180/m.16507 type:complete len:163 (+) Transcript_17180:128-616(+)